MYGRGLWQRDGCTRTFTTHSSNLLSERMQSHTSYISGLFSTGVISNVWMVLLSEGHLHSYLTIKTKMTIQMKMTIKKMKMTTKMKMTRLPLP